jgi:hypothetical protein
MFDIYINVYVFNFDITTNKLNIVSLDQEKFVPLNKKLNSSDLDIKLVYKEILSDSVICNIDSLKPILFDIQISNNNFNVNYIVTTPIDLKLSGCYYIDVERLMLSNKTIQKALLYV